jgi:hypothetical protein
MHLLLSRTMIATVAKRYAEQYPEGGASGPATRHETREALFNLDPATATAADVARIIGNKSWSYFSCDECAEYVEKAVSFNREYGSETWALCTSCLRAAAALGSVVLP